MRDHQKISEYPMSSERSNPPALPHTELTQLFDGVYFVTGTVIFKWRLLAMRVSRNMTILRDGERLTLINSLRLSEAGLTHLEKLGKVENAVRLAAYHGMHDPFYKQRYGAKVWSVDAPYFVGLDPDPKTGTVYFEPDVLLGAKGSDDLPIRDSHYIEFGSSTPREAVLLIEREGGIVISGDCFQNIRSGDPFTGKLNLLLGRTTRLIRPYNIGPGWYHDSTPDPNEIAGVLDRGFEHLLPVHGQPVIGNASELFRPRVSQLQSRYRRLGGSAD